MAYMYTEHPEETRVIVGSMNMAYDIYRTLPGIELTTYSVPSAHRFLYIGFIYQRLSVCCATKKLRFLCFNLLVEVRPLSTNNNATVGLEFFLYSLFYNDLILFICSWLEGTSSGSGMELEDHCNLTACIRDSTYLRDSDNLE